MFKVTEILNLNEVARHFDWVIHECSSQDKSSIQEGFSKLINKLKAEEPIKDNQL